jgi:hypothetical protein
LEQAVGTALPSDSRIGSDAVAPLRLPEQTPGAGHDMQDMKGMKMPKKPSDEPRHGDHQ